MRWAEGKLTVITIHKMNGMCERYCFHANLWNCLDDGKTVVVTIRDEVKRYKREMVLSAFASISLETRGLFEAAMTNYSICFKKTSPNPFWVRMYVTNESHWQEFKSKPRTKSSPPPVKRKKSSVGKKSKPNSTSA